MSGRGRPKEDRYDKYVKGKEDTVRAACRKGVTNEELAKLLGCGRTTIQALLKENPEFKEIVDNGKREANLAVENALFKRAVGYEYEEVFTEVKVNKDGSGTTTYVKKTKKHVVPDVLAQMAWLRNRQPDLWNIAQQKIEPHKAQQSIFGETIDNMSEEELDKFIAKHATNSQGK